MEQLAPPEQQAPPARPERRELEQQEPPAAPVPPESPASGSGASITAYQNNQNADLVVSMGTFQTIPGLSRTVNLASPAMLLVSTHGVIQTQSLVANGFSAVDVQITINGAQIADGGLERHSAMNNGGVTGGFTTWALQSFATTVSGSYTLAAGSYTIAVRARLAQGSAAYVGSDNTLNEQGTMQIMVMP